MLTSGPDERTGVQLHELLSSTSGVGVVCASVAARAAHRYQLRDWRLASLVQLRALAPKAARAEAPIAPLTAHTRVPAQATELELLALIHLLIDVSRPAAEREALLPALWELCDRLAAELRA